MKSLAIMVILGLLIIVAFIISMNSGYIKLSPLQVLKTLFGGGTAKESLILFDFRLPRIVISVLVGAGLAVSGCILQGITRNGLADPSILGIVSGAGLVVVLFISYFPSTSPSSVFLLPFLAFVGASLTAALIYALAFKKGEGISPIRLLLNGIGVSAGISAAMLVLTLRMSPENYKFVAVWLAGSIWGTSWKFVIALFPWIVILLPFSFYKARVLNVLNLNEQTAAGLGAPIEKERLFLLATAVGLAGSCVAVSGGIGFVGLIGPHLARRLVGPKHQLLLPTSALAGGLLLIIADTLARSIADIPTGVVVAIIGAPYFLYLLARSKA
ncbi:FecCD family ABC transporter permease [Paenibacillus baekrokdamisoli]